MRGFLLRLHFITELTQVQMFQTRRNSTFAVSTALHVLALSLLWIIGVQTPAVQRKLSYAGTLVYMPPEIPKPARQHVQITRPVLPEQPFHAPQTPVRLQTGILEAPVQVAVVREPLASTAPMPAAPVILPSAPPPPQTTLHTPVRPAGFEAVNSSGLSGPPRLVMNGSTFDAASSAVGGPSRRPVISGGFDTASGSGPQGPVRTSIRSGGFGDATVAPVSPAPKMSPVVGGVFRPVEILEKPKPLYTEEGRRLQVEGEVVFEALFAASGHIRILKTMNGLGHGLDEAASRAAEAIRFRPAERNGEPVDFTAAVHIVFQLAN